MSIKFAAPPAGSLLALNHTGSSSPHPVYFLDIEDLGEGKGLEAAKLVSWRYFINAEQPDATAAEVLAKPSGTHALASVSVGPIGELSPAGLGVAAEDPAVQEANFEPRLLRIFDLHCSALWLHNTLENAEDLLIPVPRIPKFLKAKQYTKVEFESELQNKAKRNLELHIGSSQPSSSPRTP